jgi:hypothetical protein
VNQKQLLESLGITAFRGRVQTISGVMVSNRAAVNKQDKAINYCSVSYFGGKLDFSVEPTSPAAQVKEGEPITMTFGWEDTKWGVRIQGDVIVHTDGKAA